MGEVVKHENIRTEMEALIKDFKEATQNASNTHDGIVWRRRQRNIMIAELDALGDKIIAKAVYSPETGDFESILKSLADFEEKLKKIADTADQVVKVMDWLTKFAKYAAILI